jgi:hypothetical protein
MWASARNSVKPIFANSNVDPAPHNITFDDAAFHFGTKDISKGGQSADITPENESSFESEVTRLADLTMIIHYPLLNVKKGI